MKAKIILRIVILLVLIKVIFFIPVLAQAEIPRDINPWSIITKIVTDNLLSGAIGFGFCMYVVVVKGGITERVRKIEEVTFMNALLLKRIAQKNGISLDKDF